MSHGFSIGVIGGTGSEGRGLALRFGRAGARVMIGSRAIDRAREVVQNLRRQAGEMSLEPADNATVVSACGIVFLAVPFAHASETITAHSDRFQPGSLLVDVTVPVTFADGAPRLIDVPEGSAAEHIRQRLPPKVALAVALKTVPARLLGQIDLPLDCDDFVCGDSAEARSRTSEVLRLIPGLRPIDAGTLETARTIERMTLLALALNRRYKVQDARFRVVGL